MKSIIDEAIDAFNQNHEDRCLGNIIHCSHGKQIRRMKQYEHELEQPVRQEIANKLAENRNHWIAAKTPSEASVFTWALNDIFELAIKFALEEE
jgi:hypothetical protein